MPYDQLKTTHYFATPFAKSFTDYVLPVPAGPAGDPPKFNLSAPISVMNHLSVSGVITSLFEFPRY